MSTLQVVEQVLRRARVPLTVRQIVERAGDHLPSKAKHPDTVIARDLSLNLRKLGAGSPFVRTARGQFTLRELVTKSAIYVADPRTRKAWTWTAEQLRARALRALRQRDRSETLPP